MRRFLALLASVLLLTFPLAQAAEEKPPTADVEALAKLLQGEAYETRASVQLAFLAQGIPGIPALEKLETRVREDEESRVWIAKIYADLRIQLCRVAAGLEQPAWLERLPEHLAACGPNSLHRLGVERTTDGAWHLSFPVRTLADPNRLRSLEYLAAPPSGEKDHEVLVRIEEADWTRFRGAWRENAKLVLSWKNADGESVLRSVAELLPWAKPNPNAFGLDLGRNTDESANDKLPPHATDVALLVPFAKP
ncbi:MAG: hypothetical protein HS116_09515 [Planctomycetes bacterium]|nr:hypothetical protein [Planctomycetota bacterium]